MKKETIKLTDAQHKELQKISKVLVKHFEIKKIICFAALNSTSERNTCFAEHESNLSNDYYLLVITAGNARIESTIQDYIIGKKHPGVYIIAHGADTVYNAIKRQDRFFLNACLNGCLIYTEDGFSMIPQYDEDTVQQVAIDDREVSDRVMFLAKGFLESAMESVEKNYYNNAVFNLHQVVEHSCRALVKLYTGYNIDIHNISRLIDFTNCISPEPKQLFRLNSTEDLRLFRILVTSYKDARYTDDYNISKADANQLIIIVNSFFDLAIELVKKAIEQETAKAQAEVLTGVGDHSPALPASL